MGKIYQITIKYSKWPQNIPNGHKIGPNLLLKLPPKFTKLGFLVSKRAIW
jgi:hypothetical protein